jgi:hypothetical protein
MVLMMAVGGVLVWSFLRQPLPAPSGIAADVTASNVAAQDAVGPVASQFVDDCRGELDQQQAQRQAAQDQRDIEQAQRQAAQDLRDAELAQRHLDQEAREAELVGRERDVAVQAGTQAEHEAALNARETELAAQASALSARRAAVEAQARASLRLLALSVAALALSALYLILGHRSGRPMP